MKSGIVKVETRSIEKKTPNAKIIEKKTSKLKRSKKRRRVMKISNDSSVEKINIENFNLQ